MLKGEKQDVPLDGADWARCLAVAPAWGAWVRRAFRAAEETRRRELKDEPQADATSWLWARDALTEAIKANCTIGRGYLLKRSIHALHRGRASQQGNALLALCALLEATTEHLQGLDTGARRQAARTHTAWVHALLDLVLECCGLSPSRQEPSERAGTLSFQWLLKLGENRKEFVCVCVCARVCAWGLLLFEATRNRTNCCIGSSWTLKVGGVTDPLTSDREPSSLQSPPPYQRLAATVVAAPFILAPAAWPADPAVSCPIRLEFGIATTTKATTPIYQR
ncbi:hypothetical protein HPB49_008469 [Dermacentor silvarum]|uniref:Uncharacterized protein n=1 Tax=Dermacentor silvarum TaxID=543639 RepID=A0ACB8D460_DERSI|nr:hypothetical protein HPB49_008469 [Dermacentor silvarum]